VITKHQHPARLLQPIQILEWKWEVISMDFITGLPKTVRQHDAIMVVVDKLSKVTHFIPIKSTYKEIEPPLQSIKRTNVGYVCRKSQRYQGDRH
jgi:hypothetical protein